MINFLYRFDKNTGRRAWPVAALALGLAVTALLLSGTTARAQCSAGYNGPLVDDPPTTTDDDSLLPATAGGPVIDPLPNTDNVTLKTAVLFRIPNETLLGDATSAQEGSTYRQY